MDQEFYNLRMKGMDIDGYTNRFHELALQCPRMVEPEAVKVEQYNSRVRKEKVKVIEEVVVIIDESTTAVKTRGEARKYIENGCELFLAQVTGTVSKVKRVKDVPIIRDFPEDLPGLLPPMQVEFRIDLVPGATPVARTPYRLAPSELKELSKQLKELSEK
nr:putative reverse transcriptase domain-containing protein [Tanacetum cinerariifolium]